MADATLTINQYSWNKITVDEMRVTAQGWPEYPRLIIPVSVGINPIEDMGGKTKRHFVILDAQCSLFVEDHAPKLADANSGFNRCEVSCPRVTTQFHLEFPLSVYQVKKIEEKRKGNITFRLDFYFRIGLYNPLDATAEGKRSTE